MHAKVSQQAKLKDSESKLTVLLLKVVSRDGLSVLSMSVMG